MKNLYFLLLWLFGTLDVTAQITITSEDSPTDLVSIFTSQKLEGSPYDTAVFDSINKVPFKIHEWRGEEMIHNWISLGAPRAPHLYLGAGIYRFDKYGLTDVQFGWYPIVYPNVWETYFAASQMIFLKKKSKMVKTSLCIDEDYSPGLKTHKQFEAQLRRDKFYGITCGFAYEGIPNLKNKTLYLYQFQDATGEQHDIVIEKYRQINVNVGLSRMRCRNVEYDAPFRRKGHFTASSMSRLTLGVAYYPVLDVSVLMDTGYYVEYLYRAMQKDFSAFFSWEGRTAFLHMKRECGVHMNFIFTYPTWNRVNDSPMSLVWTWGLYFSLDKKAPKWKQRLDLHEVKEK